MARAGTGIVWKAVFWNFSCRLFRMPRESKNFETRFESMWDGWSEDGGCLLKQPGDAHKQDQKTFYDEDALSYETQMLRLPFWNAQTAI